jgi:hypothetical protein
MNFNYPRILADVHDTEEVGNEKEVIQLDINYFLNLKDVVRDERRGYGRDIYYSFGGPSMYNEDIPTVYKLGVLTGIKEIIMENYDEDDISLPEGFLDEYSNNGVEYMIELTFYNDYVSDDPDYPEPGYRVLQYHISDPDFDLYMIPYEQETKFPGKLSSKNDLLPTGEHARKTKKPKTRHQRKTHKTGKSGKSFRSRSNSQKRGVAMAQGGKKTRKTRKNKKMNKKTT